VARLEGAAQVMTIKITVLETIRFDAKEHPYNLLGYWGCAFSLCPQGQRVVPGQMAHKVEIDKDVDLIHPNCLIEMKKELQKQGLKFEVHDSSGQDGGKK
jgi:hypothetical protein